MIVGSALDLPGPQRRQRVGPVEAWIWVFSSTEGTSALSSGLVRVEPDDVDGLLGQAWIPADLEGLEPIGV